jgi:hypothetical protein
MMERFTDRARAAVRSAFGRRPEAAEREVIAALLAGRGVAAQLLRDTDFGVDGLPAGGPPVERSVLVVRATEVARRRGANHVGTEHLLLAVADLPGSALAAGGASVEHLDELLSAAEAEWRRSHPPLARRVGAWCRSILRWVRQWGRRGA